MNLTVRSRRTPSVIWLLAGVLLVAVVAACGGDDEPDGVLATLSATSGDVEIAVEVPEGALPSGVALSDISVVGLDRDEAFADHEGVEPLGAYRLEPAGLEFEVPLRLTVELPGRLSGVQALLVSSDGTAETLEPAALAVSTSDETVRATYEIEHFSDIELFRSRKRGDAAAIVMLPPPPKPSYFVGESFTVRVRVHAGSAAWTVVRLVDGQGVKQDYATLPDEPWSAEIRWWTGDHSARFIDAFNELGTSSDRLSPLEPQKARTEPTAPNTGTAVFSEQTFTCRRAGAFVLGAMAYVHPTGELTITRAGGASTVSMVPQSLAAGSIEPVGGTCVAPDSTVDPTPDPTETMVTPEPTEDPTSTPPPIAPTLEAGFSPCGVNPNEDAIGCLPHYNLVSASNRVPITDGRHMYQSTWEFGAPIPTNPEHVLEYWLVLEGEHGQRMEFLLEGGPGQPLTCTRSVNGIPTPLGPGEACGELFAPNTLRFAGDVSAFAPGRLDRTFSTLEIGEDGRAHGAYAASVGESALQLSVAE